MFKDQIDAAEKEKVEKLIVELREIAVEGRAGDASVNADKIREKANETQQAAGVARPLPNGLREAKR